MEKTTLILTLILAAGLTGCTTITTTIQPPPADSESAAAAPITITINANKDIAANPTTDVGLN